MLNKKVLKVLNEQVNAEFYASQIYLSMSAYFGNKGLSGFSKWMRLQYEEECEHALKIYDYILERGEKVELLAIEKPKKEWKNVKEAVSDALAHEKLVTSMINKIMDISIEEKEYATVNLMNWYVEEQVEEESSIENILDQLNYAGEESSALLMIDRELGSRLAE